MTYAVGLPVWSFGRLPASPHRPGAVVAAVLATACSIVVQLWLLVPAARARRPRHAGWLIAAFAAINLAAFPLIGVLWFAAGEQFAVLAAVFLPLRWSVPVVAALVAVPAATGADYLYYVTYYTATGIILPAALYASARLVRVAGELRGARIALAEAAVSRERLRVSRDLHDLLGHSLAAISLKGDLAIRLLRRDRAAALAEIENLTEVAREALAGLRAITAGGPKVTLAGELDSARALLAAAGVAVRVRGDISAIPPAHLRSGRLCSALSGEDP
ncbi:MAG TPA: histidine kinase dimerization/phosphoacceptor domain-containing protein [Trebonia sp.]